MSVSRNEKLRNRLHSEGKGRADQPSILFQFDGGGEIREVARGRSPGKARGSIIEREETSSSPNKQLPELSIPGNGGRKYEDCGDDIPAFACLDHPEKDSRGCGRPIYIGRTCASPTCSRCWASAIKRKTTRYAGKLRGYQQYLYACGGKTFDVDLSHVVASPPNDIAFDTSKSAIQKFLLVVQTILRESWGIEGFCAIFHPYRIKEQYRKDVYDHGDGSTGQGDMRWKNILNAENPMQYLTFSPHFHLFFPHKRASFDYQVSEAVYNDSGIVFHRITKSDSEVSVDNIEDLTRQMMYCFSHAGVVEDEKDKLCSRLKGELVDKYAPDKVTDKVLSAFCNASPDLLGVTFVQTQNTTCQAPISEPASDGIPDYDGENTVGDSGWDSASYWFSRSTSGVNGGQSTNHPTEPPREVVQQIEQDDSVDTRDTCGGRIRPIQEASSRLQDLDWRDQAEYLEGLEDAFEEYQKLSEEYKSLHTEIRTR